MVKRANIFLLFLLMVNGVFLMAQNELGNPYIKNYSPKDYNSAATIWDITQDAKGLMYFGGANGVIQYDGLRWRVIPVDNETTVRSLDADKNGCVYVGAKSEFGYLKEDSLGQLYYQSISYQLAEKYQDFADVWNTYVTDEGVFFLTFKRIYRWHNNEISVFEYDDITAHLGFYVNKKLYLVLQKKGLHVFNGNDFEPVPGGMYYTNKTIFSIMPYDNEHVLVAARKDGLELMNVVTGEITPFENEVNDQLKINKIYHGAMSEQGEYIIATLKKGIYVIDKKGRLQMHINQQNGLQNDNIKYAFKDRYGALWLGTAVGISYVDLNLPLTFFTADNGLQGYCRDIVRHQNVLYVATGNGVFYLDEEELDLKKKFKPIEYADGQFWDLLSIEDKLYVGGTHAIYEIEDKKLKRAASSSANAVFGLFKSEAHPNLVYASLKKGLAILKFEEGKLLPIHKFEEYDIESHHVNEDRDGNLWVSTAFDFLVKIDKTSFNEEKGFPLSFKKIEYAEKISSEQIIKIDNQIYFTSQKGLLKANEKDELKLTNPFVLKGLKKGATISRLHKDVYGNLWVHYHYEKTSGQFLAIKSTNNNYIVKEDPFTRINEKISHADKPYVEKGGITWFMGGEGLIRYDYNKDIKERKNYHVNIRKIALHSDSIIAYGTNMTKSIDNFTFSFSDNATSFTFSAASYGNEKENQYQYFLEGYDEDWSDWTTASTKEYNYLPENKYTFRVRAKNIYNQISNEDQFTFVVLPPWYRETWAYVAYVILFFILIYLIIKVATYRLQQSKRQLEAIVQERTRDIKVEKEKVEEQKLLLEDVHNKLAERNKDVMDSIKYAQRIQSSILPPLDKLYNEFKEAFVLYKPRDIVSGDFYWYEKVGDYFVFACADCTGHGVPGAFMSMIGTTLLQKIVERDEITSCELALAELDNELQKTLQQTSLNGNTTVMDGMDISLIAINVEKKECHFSGAYRPLYLIRNNEIQVFSSNRFSLGGGFIKKKEFKGASIDIQQGDLLYMFTDGVTDQFGGQKNKKFKPERLKQLLLKIAGKSMKEQQNIIEKNFEEWRGDNEQIDDVLITGIKIP